MRHCWLLFLMACLCAGCSLPPSGPLAGCGNGVYYWRTTFSLDSTERVFLRQHHIDRIFCRYFDVVLNDQGEPMPNATLAFDAKMPDSIEIVPTVFVMENCMREPYIDSLASRLVRRVLQMNETNDISTTGELQIDCDYTARSRQTYYRFLERVKAELAARLSPVSSQLSVTIRLHQLSMPAPPADYGVLMLYNTGAPERFAERNPILDMRDVKPYLKHLKDYPLPLAAAYPVFRWQRTLHGVSIDHVAQYDEILQAKQAVEAERDDVRRHIVTYHLDKENIQCYQPEQYEAIYRH
ncbi:MAG: hypothetical protein IJ841_02285 [Prevotella sp.]|nr:hypothetical protein [Prevotella sp.]